MENTDELQFSGHKHGAVVIISHHSLHASGTIVCFLVSVQQYPQELKHSTSRSVLHHDSGSVMTSYSLHKPLANSRRLVAHPCAFQLQSKQIHRPPPKGCICVWTRHALYRGVLQSIAEKRGQRDTPGRCRPGEGSSLKRQNVHGHNGQVLEEERRCAPRPCRDTHLQYVNPYLGVAVRGNVQQGG